MPEKVKGLLFNWFFEASCDKHDRGYEEGGNELRRLYCDYRFFKAMCNDVKRVKWYYKPLALSTSVSFFSTVVLFGWTSFNYR